ncbi:hypothetical protein BN128_3494 [Cronobacter sakazakii 696]|nr:hypothetical protein BN128_3494 [Cronobacter sakazakii 696]
MPPCHTTKSDPQAEGAFAPWLRWRRALTTVTDVNDLLKPQE